MQPKFSIAPVGRYRYPSALVALWGGLNVLALQAVELEEVVVVGNRDLSRSTSVGKLNVSVTETPFSVSVRDQEFLRAVGAKTVQDSLLHMAGVNGGTYGVDSRGDWSTIRGVEPVIYIDGLQSLYGSYTGARATAYAYERVEPAGPDRQLQPPPHG